MTALDERFPEWAAFAGAVQARRPEAPCRVRTLLSG
jgi:hypothetical protein